MTDGVEWGVLQTRTGKVARMSSEQEARDFAEPDNGEIVVKRIATPWVNA